MNTTERFTKAQKNIEELKQGTKTLDKLLIRQLEAICLALKLRVQGSPYKRATFVEPLEQWLERERDRG